MSFSILSAIKNQLKRSKKFVLSSGFLLKVHKLRKKNQFSFELGSELNNKFCLS